MKCKFQIPIIICLLISFPSVVYPAKPDAAVAPLAVIGDITEPERVILANRFEKLLAQTYRLIPQAQYQKAEKEIFRSLEVEKCTESYCIMKIQELLQVERLFFLAISKIDNLIQLNVTLAREEEK